MRRLFVPAFLVLAAAAGAILAQAGSPATIVVRVPADAKVSVGNQQMTTPGAERRFVSPDLESGYSYSYQVEARWTENGKEVKVARSVSFRPGETVTVDFRTSTAGAAPTQQPKVAVQPTPVKPIQPVQPTPPKVAQVDPKPPVVQPVQKGTAKVRNFLFTYSGTVKDLQPGQEAKVWLPVAESTSEQTISIDSVDVPAKHQIGKEKQYGNSILFFQAKADSKGEVPFKVVYRVGRKEVLTDVKAGATLKPREDKSQLARFLQPDAKVPVVGRPLDLLRENLKDKPLPNDQFQAGKVLYDVVNTHMKYSKEGTGWGQGDSVWACDSKFGNCTDFHSLFISMARGNKIPSKFEMGFPVPPKRGEGPIGGYHCWAWFMPQGKGWVPVDISEANRFPELREYYFGNLTEDRVQFTTGRDINLVPPQAGPPLNFLIYPYVEVNGKTYPADKVGRVFAYRDL